MADKGEYRGIYTALPHDPDFQDLTPEARACWYPLKLELGLSGIDICYPETVARLSGYPTERVAEALADLEANGWLRRERNVFWLIDAVARDPGKPLDIPNSRKSIQKHLATLPKLAVVNDFARRHGFDIPFPDAEPIANPSATLAEHGERRTENGNGERKTEIPTPTTDEGGAAAGADRTTAAAVGEFCTSVGVAWKLGESIADWADGLDRDPHYAGVDIPYEIRCAAEWHRGKGRKPAPHSAIRNWLKKSAADAKARNRAAGKDVDTHVAALRMMLAAGGDLLRMRDSREAGIERIQKKRPDLWKHHGTLFVQLEFPPLLNARDEFTRTKLLTEQVKVLLAA